MSDKYNKLPQHACLNAEDIATYLGISRSLAYEMLHRSDFPHILVGEKRLVCPREDFIEWLETQLKNNKNIGGE